MAVTWVVTNIEKVAKEGSLSDVCKHVYWTAYEQEKVADSSVPSGYIFYEGRVYGKETLGEADSSKFTAFADITLATAVSWVKDILGADKVAEIETSVAAKLAEQKAPEYTIGVPW